MVYHGFPFSVLKVSIVEAVAANAAHQRLSSSCFSLWRALVGSAGGAHLMGGIARLSPEGAGLAVWSASPLLAQGFRCSSACALACGVVRTGYASLVTTGVAREERESVCVCVGRAEVADAAQTRLSSDFLLAILRMSPSCEDMKTGPRHDLGRLPRRPPPSARRCDVRVSSSSSAGFQNRGHGANRREREREHERERERSRCARPSAANSAPQGGSPALHAHLHGWQGHI